MGEFRISSVFSNHKLTSILCSASPTLHSFDRILPTSRNDSLPLVVLYASPTDERFPALFDFLHNLASPKSVQPRLQFALRWKTNKDAPANSLLNHFDVQAVIERAESVNSVGGKCFIGFIGFNRTSVTHINPSTPDLSLKMTAFVEKSSDKIETLVKVAQSLPQFLDEVSSVAVPEALSSVVDTVKENNFVVLNGVKISTEEGIDSQDLLQAMRTDGYLLNTIQSIIYADEKLASSILANASITLEEPKDKSKGPVLPTKERPLEFVNLVEATQGLGTALTRSSYLEGGKSIFVTFPFCSVTDFDLDCCSYRRFERGRPTSSRYYLDHRRS